MRTLPPLLVSMLLVGAACAPMDAPQGRPEDFAQAGATQEPPQAPPQTTPSQAEPPQAAAVGYTANTYHVGSFTPLSNGGNTDDQCGMNGGTYYPWGGPQKLYCFNFFGWSPLKAPGGRRFGYDVQINHLRPNSPRPPKLDGSARGSDGSVTLWDDVNNNTSTQLSTVGQVRGGWVGIAFGCGAYIESTVALDPAALHDLTQGHPAAWAMAVEHLAPMAGPNPPTEQWIGQPSGYTHFAELDYAEFFGVDGAGGALINTAPIDWFGQPGCGSGGFCKDSPAPAKAVAPATTDLRQYHRYGELWVPATATTAGYVQTYLDGQPFGRRFSYSRYLNNGSTTPSPTAAFNGSISGTTLTVSALASTGGRGAYRISVGQTLTGRGITAGTKITGVISGAGGPGAYSVSVPQQVAMEPMVAVSPWLFGVTDVNHMALIWGASANGPITVRSVDVWQNPETACNLTR